MHVVFILNPDVPLISKRPLWISNTSQSITVLHIKSSFERRKNNRKREKHSREGEGEEMGEVPKKETHVLRGHEGAVLAARFNSDGNYFLSCGKDRTLRLWNPHRGIHIKTYKGHGREIRDVHVTSYDFLSPPPLC